MSSTSVALHRVSKVTAFVRNVKGSAMLELQVFCEKKGTPDMEIVFFLAPGVDLNNLSDAVNDFIDVQSSPQTQNSGASTDPDTSAECAPDSPDVNDQDKLDIDEYLYAP